MPDLPPVETTSLNVEISRALKIAIVAIARHNRNNISEQVRGILYTYVGQLSPEAYRQIIKMELHEAHEFDVREAVLDHYRSLLAAEPSDIPW